MNTPASNFWTTYSQYFVEAIAAIVAIVAAALSFYSARQATRVTARNTELAARVSHAAKISEFREKWLDELRRDIADFLGRAEHVLRKWEEINGLVDRQEKDRRERDELFPLANEARVILLRIRLRLNPRENEFKSKDDALLTSLDALWNPTLFNPCNAKVAWYSQAAATVEQARELLKREWEVTKRYPARSHSGL